MEVKAEELKRSFEGEWEELVYLLAFKSAHSAMTPSCKDISHILYLNSFCKPGLEKVLTPNLTLS